jgi:hypothetical protein
MVESTSDPRHLRGSEHGYLQAPEPLQVSGLFLSTDRYWSLSTPRE